MNMEYKYINKYKHINCDECGGVIGIFDRNNLTCEKCGKQFELHRMNYDRLLINDKTGWIFPMLDK